jgi:hypothetical protein
MAFDKLAYNCNVRAFKRATGDTKFIEAERASRKRWKVNHAFRVKVEHAFCQRFSREFQAFRQELIDGKETTFVPTPPKRVAPGIPTGRVIMDGVSAVTAPKVVAGPPPIVPWSTRRLSLIEPTPTVRPARVVTNAPAPSGDDLLKSLGMGSDRERSF